MGMAMAASPPNLQFHKTRIFQHTSRGASMPQCFRAIHTSQPVAWEGMKKVATYCPTENKSRCTAFNNYPCLSSFGDMAVGSVFRVKKECIRVLSFQDVSKKGDSNGREYQSSQTLHDIDRMMKQLQEQVSQYSLKLWQSLEVTTKVSLAITLLFFLAVTVRHGIQISGELLPLWIIGPWLFSNYIKFWMSVFRACVRTAINIVQSNFVQGIVRGVVVNLMRTKDALVHAKDSLIQAPQLFKQTFDTKRDYIMSGELKKFLLDKLEEWQEQIREMIRDSYLDYMEANWPNWRRTKRFLNKLFPK